MKHLTTCSLVLFLVACEGTGTVDEVGDDTDRTDDTDAEDTDEDAPLGLPPGGEADPECFEDGADDTSRCGDLDQAWTKSSVNVAYYPFEVTTPTDLVSCPGRSLEALDVGQGFAAQSTRNPGCIDSPPLMPALRGYVFGYARGSGRSGWIRADALQFTGYEDLPCADGPASADFQVNTNPYDDCRATTCQTPSTCATANDPDDGDEDCGGSSASDPRVVDAEEVYLRYAPGSTARRFLHRDDAVTVLYRSGAWAFVETTASSCPELTPVGSRGWTLLEYLAVP